MPPTRCVSFAPRQHNIVVDINPRHHTIVQKNGLAVADTRHSKWCRCSCGQAARPRFKGSSSCRHPVRSCAASRASRAPSLQADTAGTLLNRALFAMESAWHPQFRGLVINGRARLPVSEGHNALFLGACLRRVKGLILRGCTRTALEWSKMALSLDRDDPCGMLFYIDYCALRCRQCATPHKCLSYFGHGSFSSDSAVS